MIRTTLANVSQKRTIRPLYAHHQATPQGFTLDPDWSTATADILPGMVAVNLGDGTVTLSDGSATMSSYGLFAHFVAPVLGIDEVNDSGLGAIGVWVGGADAQFSILAPAFDTAPAGTGNVDWADAATALAAGTEVLLVPGSGSANRGKLTPKVPSDVSGTHAVLAAADPICRLVEIVSTTEIVVAFL